MKRICIPLIFWLLQVACLGQECVRPVVATEFGKPVMVTAEFVAKSNTYYAQNLVPEAYTLKVIAVDGRRLKEAVFIEYKLEAGKKEAKKLERVGIVQEFEAYETLYQPGFAEPWLEEGEQGMSFALHHLLRIRPEKPEANKRPDGTSAEAPPSMPRHGAAVPHP
jgi:hypothetical protein